MTMFTFSRTSLPKIQCDVCILVYNDTVLHAKTQNNVVAQPDESILRRSPTELATAARRLLPGKINKAKPLRVALALANDEFIATQVKLPAVAQQALRSALQLQLPTLLPGCTEPLLLAVQPPAHADDDTVALWLPQKRAEELFAAFKEEGLFLQAILPRAVLSLPKQAVQLLDEDKHSLTHVVWQGKTLQNWLHITQNDYAIEVFKQQFDATVRDLHNEQVTLLYKQDLADWDNLAMPHAAVYHYAVIPPQAMQHFVQQKQSRQRRGWAIAAMLLIMVGITSLGATWYYKQQLEQQLQALKSKTLDISRLQAEVVNIEENIAPVQQFPRQQIPLILKNLNSLIPKNSWLTSIAIDEGVVEIEGYSPSPETLLKELNSDIRFAEVGFSRGTRKDRQRTEESFGIHFKLNDVDLKAYLQKYFGAED